MTELGIRGCHNSLHSWEGTGGQNLPPPVPFCPASPASFTGNILYYITQTKDKSRRVNQKRIFARAFVSFVYFDAICKSNNMIMLKLFIIFFFNVLSMWSPASGPLKTPASRNLSPGLRPLSSPTHSGL